VNERFGALQTGTGCIEFITPHCSQQTVRFEAADTSVRGILLASSESAGIFPAGDVPGRLDASRKNVFQRFLLDVGGQRRWKRRPEALFLWILTDASGRRWKPEWCPGAESRAPL
jgi:hypothetical protein